VHGFYEYNAKIDMADCVTEEEVFSASVTFSE